MNRAERRERARFERAKRQREAPAECALLDRSGKVCSRVFMRQQSPIDQMRLIKAGQGFASVAEADAAGRIDLVRTFVRDRGVAGPPWIFREQEDGRDLAPHEPVVVPQIDPSLVSFDLSPWPGLREQIEELLEVFPSGELWPLEAALFAMCGMSIAKHGGLNQESTGAILEDLRDFLDRSGYGAAFDRKRIREAIATLPRLRLRYLELTK